MNIRKKALEFATKAHAGQKRKDGKDYISHPLAVAEIAEKIAKDRGIGDYFLDDLYVISVFHDQQEDAPQYSEAAIEEFGDYIFQSVLLLSRSVGETYFDFIYRIVGHFQETRDPLPLIVKISDITHNLLDLQEGSMKDKYRFAKDLLEKVLDSH